MEAAQPRFLKLPAVTAAVALRKTAIYSLIKAGAFPAPVALTATARAWRSDEIQAWIDARSAARNARAGAP